MGAMRNVHKIVDGKPEGKRPLKRPRCTWEDNIRMDLIEVFSEGMDWIHLVQYTSGGCCEYSNEPSCSVKCRECMDKQSDC
jgi:hypothetical protein